MCNGRRTVSVHHLWGEARLPVQRLERRRTGEQFQVPLDPSQDTSGWTPYALERLLDLAARLPFEEAARVASGFGLVICPAQLARLSAPYDQACQVEVKATLSEQALVPLARAQPTGSVSGQAGQPGRVMVLQADGVCVLGQPEAGHCPGIEVKSLILYPQASPGERVMVADVVSSEQVLALTAGLLRAGGVRVNDNLVAVTDGALWLEGLCQTLGVPQVIDVFHAVQYLETVLVAAGWSEAEREVERRAWMRGEVNVEEWLSTSLPPEAKRAGWDEEARKALAYLQARARRMAYRDYKAPGWPIGSGQVEGMNKAVIGHRLKRSGMHWSRAGAGRMAARRAQVCSKRALVSHERLRFKAFPVPPF